MDTEIVYNLIGKITHIMVSVPITVTCHFTGNKVEQ